MANKKNKPNEINIGNPSIIWYVCYEIYFPNGEVVKECGMNAVAIT